MIRLVVFLGNPGNQYAKNRHNAGWLLAEHLPFYSLVHWEKKFKGFFSRIEGDQVLTFYKGMDDTGYKSPDGCNGTVNEADSIGDRVKTLPISQYIYLLKPGTYMNLSGESVVAATSYFKIKPEHILVLHDELELPVGSVSLKFSGGLGGHNGLRSMKSCLGTADFWRFRIGIGRPSHTDIAGWVLSDFTHEESAVLTNVFTESAKALIAALSAGPDRLLPEWNKKKII
ncbi:aminoacyl-tRNA hydrolase [Treponema sp. OttesenSCG-928-L16]|nr:aminoacyl-tRNA hydrolase [Treponema sp. OttesenSCG-928-L16]